MGNPVVKNIRHYRKTIVSRCKQLKYLDDRPVFDEERRRVDAWAIGFAQGGLDAANEAEQNELKVIRKEKDDADERNFRAFEQLMREGQAIKKQREQDKLAAQTASASSSSSSSSSDNIENIDDTNKFSGETVIHVPESESLRIARENRWKSDDTSQPSSSSSSSSPSLPLHVDSNSSSSSIMPPPPPSSSAPSSSSIKTTSSDDSKPVAWKKLQIEEVDDDDDDNDDENSLPVPPSIPSSGVMTDLSELD